MTAAKLADEPGSSDPGLGPRSAGLALTLAHWTRRAADITVEMMRTLEAGKLDPDYDLMITLAYRLGRHVRDERRVRGRPERGGRRTMTTRTCPAAACRPLGRPLGSPRAAYVRE
jgi:hypothetical protein